MPTNFPAALDDFENPTGDQSQSTSRTHSEQHGDLNDAIEAMQARMGITNSLDPDSLEYRVLALQSSTVITPDRFGALGSLASDDDSVAFQAALDFIGDLGFGTLQLVQPEYFVKNLEIHSGTRIVAPGNQRLTLCADALDTDYMISNENVSTYTDVGIGFDGVVFDGNNLGNGVLQTRFSSLVRLHRVVGARVNDCVFQNFGYIGLAFGGSRHVSVRGCRFTGLGYNGAAFPVANAGPGLWAATLAISDITGITQANPAVVTDPGHGYSNGMEVFISAVNGMQEINGQFYTIAGVTTDTYQLVGVNSTSYTAYTSGGYSSIDHPEDFSITGNDFHDNPWTPTHLSVRRCIVANNKFRNNMESGLYAPHTGGTVAEDFVIIGNNFDNTEIAYISGSAMELQLIRAVISGNNINGSDSCAIALSSSRNITITGNNFGNTNRDGVGGAAIQLVIDNHKGVTENITITGNTFYDDEDGTTAAAIIGFPAGAGPTWVPAANIHIANNNMIGPFLSPTDLLDNGGFDADTDWTKGAGWTIAAGVATAAASSAALAQGQSTEQGKLYYVTFTISGYTGGSVTPRFTGGDTVLGTARSANGTYSEYIRSAGNTSFDLLGAAFTGNIDNVSLFESDAFRAFSASFPLSSCFIYGNTGYSGARLKWPRVQVGQFTLTGTGNQSVTGIGYRPKRLELKFLVPGAGTFKKGESTIEADGSATCDAMMVTAASCSLSNRGNIALSLIDIAAAETTRAAFVSFDTDGFTLNTSVNGDTPVVRWVAHPFD